MIEAVFVSLSQYQGLVRVVQIYVLPHLNLNLIHGLGLTTEIHERGTTRSGSSLTSFSGSFKATGKPDVFLVTMM